MASKDDLSLEDRTSPPVVIAPIKNPASRLHVMVFVASVPLAAFLLVVLCTYWLLGHNWLSTWHFQGGRHASGGRSPFSHYDESLGRDDETLVFGQVNRYQADAL